MMSSRDTEPVLSRGSLFAGLATLSVPLALYTVIAVVTSVNIPYQDDFDSIGAFVERFTQLHGLGARLVWSITAQHVQYKLIFLQAICVLQYLIAGHTNYRVLQLLGDASMPLLAFLLWLILARSKRVSGQRLWLFFTPACVILAPCYAETINWAMSGLQNMAVIPFAVATLYFATKSSKSYFPLTITLLVLTICTSGNGFFLAAVLLFLLLTGRRNLQAVIALLFTILMAVVYAIHYRVFNVYESISFAASVRSILTFPFAFLGNLAASINQAILCGLLLIAAFILLTVRGWRRVCPASFGAALFCLTTAAGVTVTRYRSGASGALAGHYAMYSVLLVALEYIAVVRLFVPAQIRARRNWFIGLVSAAVIAFVFCLHADAHGYRNLHARRRNLIAHLILWQRHPDHLVLVPDEDPAVRQPSWIPIRISFQQSLASEIDRGLYIPPYSPSDPLPVRSHSPSTLGIEDEAAPPPSAGARHQ